MVNCDTCDEDFDSQKDCDRHMKANDHYGRYMCDYYYCHGLFRTQRDLNWHIYADGHGSDYECETCSRVCQSLVAIRQHMNATNHHRPEDYCESCGLEFSNKNALQMHLNSRTHRGTLAICPYCQASYATPSGMLHHIETGSCPEARDLDRDELLDRIQGRDVDNRLTFSSSSSEEDESAEAERNRYSRLWECSVCGREFNNWKSANAHVNSPTHRQCAYHCPNDSCGRRFVTLAACFGHLESFTCGYMSFDETLSSLDSVMNEHWVINI